MPSCLLYIDTTHIAIRIQHNAFGLFTYIVIEMPTNPATKQSDSLA